MRHEYRGGHCAQHAAVDAKHELTVAAHHDEIDTLIARMGE